MTDEVGLRTVVEDDIEIFYRQQLEPEGIEMAAFPARTREEHLAHWDRIMNDDDVAIRTITFVDDVAGNIGSWRVEDRWVVGYRLGKSFWGKGIATRALKGFVAEVPLRPLYAFVATHNVGSIRVLEKCGFHRTGESRTGDDGVEEVSMVLDA